MRFNLALISVFLCVGCAEAPPADTEDSKVKVQETPPSPHDTEHAAEENPLDNPRDGMEEEEEAATDPDAALVRTATYKVILGGAPLNKPTGISFRKDTGSTDELWVVNNANDYVTKIKKPGLAGQVVESKIDAQGASSHFMHYSMGIAMGSNNAWGVCGENDRNDHFMGPSLFSADFNAVFGKVASPNMGLGSHLDMLHNSPFCMGITHVSANKFWIFNGHYGSLDLTDFAVDHGPGQDDHSDGRILRYAKGLVKRQVGVPSQLVLDSATNLLYVADTGNGRVIALDTTTGNKSSKLIHVEYNNQTLNMDQLGVGNAGWFYEVKSAKVTDIVAPGVMQRPSGITLLNDELWVTDNKTSNIHVFALDGTPTAIYKTGFAAGSLTGITASPDGKIYFLDLKASKVYRLDL